MVNTAVRYASWREMTTCGVSWPCKEKPDWGHQCIRKPRHEGKHICNCKSWKAKRKTKREEPPGRV